MSEPNLGQAVEAFLGAHNVLGLATRGDDGRPHAASLMYASDGLIIYWVSDPASRHSRHLAADGRVAATIAPDYDDFKDIRGLQIEGAARRVEGAVESARALKLLAGKFGFFSQFLDGPQDLAGKLLDSAVYRLDCRTIALIDNTVAFGHKEILRVTP
tara:strand:- start:175 stop:648 length:474 start_codon:yes stop_codon:yes gene_type:complete